MKKLLSVLICSLGLFSFVGCYDAILQGIREEVELEDAQISGFINNITRFNAKNESGIDTEYLYLQNGLVYYKTTSNEDATHGKWHKDGKTPNPVKYNYYLENGSSGFSGTFFYKSAADGKYIYILGFEPEQDDDSGLNVSGTIKLYCSEGPGKEWKEVAEINKKIEEYVFSLKSSTYSTYYLEDINICLFGTNDAKAENRKAYIRIGGGSGKTGGDTTISSNLWKDEFELYELNGAETSAASCMASSKAENSLGITKDTMSAVYFKGKTYFFDRLGTGKTLDSSGSDSYLIKCEGTTLCCTKDGTFTDIKITKDEEEQIYSLSTSADKSIISIAVTKNSILLGTSGKGAVRVLLDSEGKPTGNGSSDSGYSSNMSTIMTNPYIVRTLFCVDSTKNEADTVMYSSLQFIYPETTAGASYDNVGLWSYYPSRGNWNRE